MRKYTRHDYPIENIFDWGYIEIPADWTPLQADKMVTILGKIDEKIWDLYGDDLVDLAKAQTYVGHPSDCDPNSPYDPDEEDIPF